MLFSYGSGQQRIDNNEKCRQIVGDFDCHGNAAVRCGVHGPMGSTSRASLKATGCRHRSSACAVLPRQPPWSTNLNETHKTLTKHNF